MSPPPQVSARAVDRGSLRCPWCHEAVAGSTETVGCAGCGTRYHPECGGEAGRCTTLGCGDRALVAMGAPSPPAMSATPAAPSILEAWHALSRPVALLLGVGVIISTVGDGWGQKPGPVGFWLRFFLSSILVLEVIVSLLAREDRRLARGLAAAPLARRAARPRGTPSPPPRCLLCSESALGDGVAYCAGHQDLVAERPGQPAPSDRHSATRASVSG